MNVRALAKAAYFHARSLSGGERLRLRRLRHRPSVVVLNLHRVSDVDDAYWPSLPPKRFEQLLRFLERHFRVVSVASPAEWDGRPQAILSFDDGYHDFLETVAPLLRKHGLTANLNVIPECVVTGQAHWNVQLYDLLNDVPFAAIREIRLPGFSGALRDDSRGDKLAFGVAVSRFLKNRSHAERAPLWAELLHQLAPYASGRTTRMLGLADLKQLADVAELGAHSCRHDSMGFESLEYFRDDVAACRDFFETQLDVPMEIYAFPNGSYRDEQVEHLRSLGIKRALLVDEEVATPGEFAYPRLTIYGDTDVEVRLRALGMMSR